MRAAAESVARMASEDEEVDAEALAVICTVSPLTMVRIPRVPCSHLLCSRMTISGDHFCSDDHYLSSRVG